MADLPALDLPAFIAPEVVEKRRRSRGRATAVAIGTIIILGDGSECQVAGYDRNGNPLCHPPPK